MDTRARTASFPASCKDCPARPSQHFSQRLLAGRTPLRCAPRAAPIEKNFGSPKLKVSLREGHLFFFPFLSLVTAIGESRKRTVESWRAPLLGTQRIKLSHTDHPSSRGLVAGLQKKMEAPCSDSRASPEVARARRCYALPSCALPRPACRPAENVGTTMRLARRKSWLLNVRRLGANAQQTEKKAVENITEVRK